MVETRLSKEKGDGSGENQEGNVSLAELKTTMNTILDTVLTLVGRVNTLELEKEEKKDDHESEKNGSDIGDDDASLMRGGDLARKVQRYSRYKPDQFNNLVTQLNYL